MIFKKASWYGLLSGQLIVLCIHCLFSQKEPAEEMLLHSALVILSILVTLYTGFNSTIKKITLIFKQQQ